MLNHAVIMGRLVRDPELRRTGSGIAVVSFTVAVDRDFTGKENERGADFIDCVAWRQTGEFVAKYFAKGSMIVVEGRLQIRPWNDKDGNKRRSAEIVADNVYFGDSKRGSQGGSGGSKNRNDTDAAPGVYGGSEGYGEAPAGTSDDFAMLEGEDGQLPF